LRKRLISIQGSKERFQTYFWVTTNKQCFEARDLLKEDRLEVARGRCKDARRDFSRWLNNWTSVERLNG